MQDLQQVGREVVAGGRAGNGVAVLAELLEALAGFVRERADDGLGSSVRSTPVTVPALLTAVAVDVVATENDASLVAGEQTLVGTDSSEPVTVTEVGLVDGIVRALGEDVVAGDLGDLESLCESLVQAADLGSVTRLVNGDVLLPVGHLTDVQLLLGELGGSGQGESGEERSGDGGSEHFGCGRDFFRWEMCGDEGR